ncbi:hypothetical protein BB558_005715 [Smittium angustum]|uniref:Oligopeptide transporter n=1 Tax=Smittium angustum TaxID=133377 RepID=A0A2U1IZS1_SMIAN|nr:hypothetical protein BB558_005715 [Smittium angustum]
MSNLHYHSIQNESTPNEFSSRTALVNSEQNTDSPGYQVESEKMMEKSHFTLRSIIVGLLFGTILCFSNMYFGLQTGWISMMSLQSSLVGFAVFKILQPYLETKFSIYENVLVQTTAVAAATMPLAGGFVGILPAFNMLDPEEIGDNHLLGINMYELSLWGFGLSLFGVFFAILLRKQVLVREKLRFPSGTATAQMIAVLHKRKDLEMKISKQISIQTGVKDPDNVSEIVGLDNNSTLDNIFNSPESLPHTSDESRIGNTNLNNHEHDDSDWQNKIILLVISFSISSLYAIISNFYPKLKKLPIFGSYLSETWLWNLNPSPSFAGQGIIMGLPTTIHMLLGALVGWGILSPLAKLKGWAPGKVDDWKTGSQGWILWISLSIMVVESFTSLALIIYDELLSAYERRITKYSRIPGGASDSASISSEESVVMESKHLVPNSVAWIGLVISTII